MGQSFIEKFLTVSFSQAIMLPIKCKRAPDESARRFYFLRIMWQHAVDAVRGGLSVKSASADFSVYELSVSLARRVH